MAQPEEEKTWEDYLAAAVKAFRKEMKQVCGEILPAEFHTHRRAAQREMLLALRALIDAKIERLEKAEHATPKATRIPVE
jgi:hypothetical protein